MGQYTGNNNWVDSIYQFEETDVVLGGPDGIDNKPLKDLADRTQFLKNNLGIVQSFDGYMDINNGHTITNSNAGKFLCAFAAGVSNLTIANASTFKHGTMISIGSYCNSESVVSIGFEGGQGVYTLQQTKPKVHMHNNEQLILLALTDHFKILSACGNFTSVGEEIKARKPISNSLPLRGQLLSRILYPRLWEYVQSLSFGQEVTNEETWFWDALTYRGLFTIGNGSTTFRIPDERGMFERMIDGGRGIDIGRGHNYAGGFEWDEFKSHNHYYKDRYYPESLSELNKMSAYTREYISGNNNTGSNRTDTDNSYALYVNAYTDYVGGNETRSKNIGKIHLIKY